MAAAPFANTSPTDWGTTSNFITQANGYLSVKGATLLDARAIKSDFPEKLKVAGEAFEAAWSAYRNKVTAAQLGTNTMKEGLLSILEQLNPMMIIGRNHFKFDAALRKLFTIEDVVNDVRSKHPASISGFVNVEGRPQMGALVQIEGEEGKFAITDNRGKYEISIAAGNYKVLVTSEGMEPLVISNFKVKAGKGRRLNVDMQPAPMVLAPVETKAASSFPAVGEPLQHNSLANAVSQMMEEANLNGAAA